MSKQNLREQMPVVTAFIDDLRKVFGTDMINGQMRKGMKGEPTFWASENGREIGTRDTSARSSVQWNNKGRSYSYDIPAGASFDEAREIQRLAHYQANLPETCNE